MPNMLVPLSHHNNNHIQLSSCIISTTLFHYLLRWKELKSSSHYPGEMAIWIDSYPARELFLTHTQAYHAKVALGHLWYNSGTKFTGTTSAAQSENHSAKGDRDSNPPLGLRQWLSAHPYYHPECALELLVVPAWDELLGFAVGMTYPTNYVRGCVQHDKMTSNV